MKRLFLFILPLFFLFPSIASAERQKTSLIAKSTAAGSASYFFEKDSMVIADGDLGTDEITVTYLGLNDSDETDAYDQDGIALVISQTKPAVRITADVHVKFTKPITTNAVGLYRID